MSRGVVVVVRFAVLDFRLVFNLIVVYDWFLSCSTIATSMGIGLVKINRDFCLPQSCCKIPAHIWLNCFRAWNWINAFRHVGMHRIFARFSLAMLQNFKRVQKIHKKNWSNLSRRSIILNPTWNWTNVIFYNI